MQTFDSTAYDYISIKRSVSNMFKGSKKVVGTFCTTLSLSYPFIIAIATK